MKAQTEKIYDLLTKFDTAMLITQGREPVLHARPMAIAKVEINCDVWFFTQRNLKKRARSSRITRSFSPFKKTIAVMFPSLAARQLVDDRAQMAALWKESYKVWFPQGVNDPNLQLIRIRSHTAEYWDSAASRGSNTSLKLPKLTSPGRRPKSNANNMTGYR